MTKHTLSILTIAAAAITGSLASTADAYVTHGSWNSNKVTMRASNVSFPSGSSYRTALSNVVDRYYDNPSEMWFEQQFGDTSVGFNNGQSEVWFSSDSDYDPAYTFWWYHWLFGHIVEADVVFWNGESYTTSMNKLSLWSYGGGGRPFETTAVHEYGHAAGLSHEDDELNIMGRDWTHIILNSSTCRSYVGEDACDGLVALYGRYSGGSIEDVGVTHWKWSGRSGEYSTHAQTQMFNALNRLLGSSAFNGQRRYSVSRGQQVRVEFSYENNGETTRSVNAGFYISTNSYISTWDTRIATASMTLGRNGVWTTRHTVTIPSNLTRGQTYYLGVIVDWDNGLAEVENGNNAAYHIIRIN